LIGFMFCIFCYCSCFIELVWVGFGLGSRLGWGRRTYRGCQESNRIELISIEMKLEPKVRDRRREMARGYQIGIVGMEDCC
jgi:hypothetical protein